jgi:hypothetical protein
VLLIYEQDSFSVHRLIEQYDIKEMNIINIDQVPRYFETEPKSTITARGSREVLMKKGGTPHKNFMARLQLPRRENVLNRIFYFQG